MLGREPEHSCPASNRTTLKARFAHTEYSWAGKSENCIAKGFLNPSPVCLASQELHRKESLGLCLL